MGPVCPEGCVLKNGRRATHGPSNCQKKKKKLIAQMQPDIAAEIARLRAETDIIGTHSGHEKALIDVESHDRLQQEPTDNEGRDGSIDDVEDNEAMDISNGVGEDEGGQHSLEYITDQATRTKRFNAYKKRMVNMLNHLGQKTGAYGILYLRRGENTIKVRQTDSNEVIWVTSQVHQSKDLHACVWGKMVEITEMENEIRTAEVNTVAQQAKEYRELQVQMTQEQQEAAERLAKAEAEREIVTQKWLLVEKRVQELEAAQNLV